MENSEILLKWWNTKKLVWPIKSIRVTCMKHYTFQSCTSLISNGTYTFFFFFDNLVSRPHSDLTSPLGLSPRPGIFKHLLNGSLELVVWGARANPHVNSLVTRNRIRVSDVSVEVPLPPDHDTWLEHTLEKDKTEILRLYEYYVQFNMGWKRDHHKVLFVTDRS